MIIRVDLKENGYDIVFEHGALKKAGEYLNLNRKVLVVTDSGVPSVYAETVASCCTNAYCVTIPQGEENKNFNSYKKLLETMLENEFSRSDCVVAVGGGVVGDLSGFAAASYMRGIDFYNIPTTVLSQVDSSIGGKTAIDFGKYKNMVGAFWQPKRVIIDPDVLETLPPRQISNGLAEAVKMSLTFRKDLFERIESVSDPLSILDDIIVGSLEMKRDVVEKDEREAGLRKVLNFGHTIGHAIETSVNLNELYHGECVSLGMIPMCSPQIAARLKKVLVSMKLPVEIDFDIDKVCEAVRHDKKSDGENITIIRVNEIGSFEMKKISKDELTEMIKSLKKVG